MENFEFKSQIKQRIKNYQDFTSAQEREKYFMDLMIEFEDVEIQKFILEETKRLEKMRKYGRKTEKTSNGNYVQLSFFDLNSDVFNEAEEIANHQEPEPEYETITYTRRKRPNKVNAKNEFLITVTVEHRLENVACSKCGGELHEMGYTEVRTYNFVPAKIELHVHKEYAYKCDACSTPDKNEVIKAKRITSFFETYGGGCFCRTYYCRKVFKTCSFIPSRKST